MRSTNHTRRAESVSFLALAAAHAAALHLRSDAPTENENAPWATYDGRCCPSLSGPERPAYGKAARGGFTGTRMPRKSAVSSGCESHLAIGRSVGSNWSDAGGNECMEVLPCNGLL